MTAVDSTANFLNRTDSQRLAEAKERIEKDFDHMIGYPLAHEFDYSELYGFFQYHLNNIGDPYVESTIKGNTKEFEREVIEFYADLFRAPKDDYWGYVTNGGTEGNLFGLYLGRRLNPNGVVYHSSAAHYSIMKATDILAVPSEVVPAQPSGEIDYDELARAFARHPGKPAIILANVGTTMTEARDDILKIKEILKQQNVTQSYIHSDAAFAGVYLKALDLPCAFDFADGADSIAISGHKFIGAPMPCGIVLTKQGHHMNLSQKVSYINSLDTTLSGSRNGHTVLMMWYAIKRWGLEGFRQRALTCREVADYAETQLHTLGWSVRRNPDALTILIKDVSAPIRDKWQLATQDGWSHIMCVPGVDKEHIDKFLKDLVDGLGENAKTA
jgi:histidine decarboxylase